MEAGKTDQYYDEVDKFLGEIPTSTAGNPYATVFIQTSASPGFESIFVYESNKSSSSSSNLSDLFDTPEAIQDAKKNNAEGNTSSKTLFDLEDNSCHQHEALTTTVNQNASSLPDEQSLALALGDLSFKHTIDANLANPADSTYPFLENSQSSSNNHFSLGGNYTARPNKFSPVFESEERPTLLPHSMLSDVQLPNLISEGYSPFMTSYKPNMLSGILDGNNDARPFKANFQDPKSVLGDHKDQWQTFPEYSSSMSVNPGMHTILPPGVSLQGFEFPAPSHPQECYMNSLYHPHLAPQLLNQSNMLCSDIECERNYKSPSQYHCFTHLENHCIDGNIQRRVNSRNEPLFGGEVNPYFHMSSNHHVRQVNGDFYENDNMIKEGYNQLEPSLPRNNLARYHLNGSPCYSETLWLQQGNTLPFSCGLYSPSINSHGHHAIGKFEKQIVPRKMQIRSHRGNSNFGFGSVPSNQLPEQANNTRRVSAASYVPNNTRRVSAASYVPNNTRRVSAASYVPSCVFPNDGSTKFDVWRSQGSFLGCSDPKQDLKSQHLKYDSLNDVIGQIHILAKDQNCCRFLQSIFDKGDREDFDRIFLAIIDHVVELTTDPFGNYFIQKLVEVCTEEQLTRIVDKISEIGGELLRISFNQHGTRVVQKIIETMTTPEQCSMIVSALKPDIVSLMKNNNGSHVAQRCLENLSSKYREFLFEAAVANCIELARDRQGCCVLQKCLSDLKGELKFQLVSKLASQARDLSEDPFGNYVVQYILDRDVPWATAKILDQLEGHYQFLSLQKFSSNVVEKCLKFSGDGRRGTIVNELINDSHFLEIVQSPYGNYVIQSALRECKGALRAALVNALRPYEPTLRVSPYGKKVLSSPCYGK